MRDQQVKYNQLMQDEYKTRSDLESLISEEAQESLQLEFKSSPALGRSSEQRAELGKDVSAFANSAGGTIIYGIVEKDHVAKSIDKGIDPNEISKEWVEQVINSTISKRIEGIIITPVKVSAADADVRVAYVLTIPKSNRAPHQASDKKFYRRFNFQSIAMEEYEIEDLRRRDTSPDLHAGVSIKNARLSFDNSSELSLPTPIGVFMENDSEVLALYALVDIFLDSRIDVDHSARYEFTDSHIVTVGDNEISCTRANFKSAVPGNLPIWNGQQFSVPDLTLRFPKASRGASYLILLRISSPGMHVNQETRVIDQSSADTIKLSESLEGDGLALRLGL
jgi:hypothetical protein